MTILYSSNFESETVDVSPTGWAGVWKTRTGLSQVSGSKCIAANGQSSGAQSKYIGIAARTVVTYKFLQKAQFNGTALLIHSIGHSDGTSGDQENNFYRIDFTATASSTQADLYRTVASNADGIVATNSRSMAVSAGDTLAVELKIDGLVVELWVWNVTTESRPGSPMLTYTDSTQRAAGRMIIGYNSQNVVATAMDDVEITDGAASDTTAPTLTSASVTSVGTTTATGNISTDEANGTLYSVVSTSATAPNVAQIQAGNDHTGSAAVWASGPITVSSTGAKTTSITGLTASTSYYAHFQHKDSANNNSTVVTSAQFTTLTPDSTNPTMTGSVTISAKTTTSYTATWSAGSDNVAVTGYEYRLNAGSWVDLGAVLTVNISGRTPGATDTFEVRAYDAAGNKATALSQSVTLFIGTITIPAVKDWGTGNLKTAQTGVQVDIHNISTGALVVRKTGQTTHATTGVCVVQDAAIADATTYEVITRFADGSKGMWDYTASLT